ncbi:hypothetical protein B0H14DRAFT_2581920 [Mycena olivaceomarginata]|nr:hypothetical protein B0H14DRAFT_2581920 [Mycena olivaceomarginata]
MGYEIILDGTFGICDSRLLLFIVMVIDKDRKGVPVAFLMFSAPTGNKQPSCDYDTEILTKLLRASKSLTKCGRLYSFLKVVFCLFTGITDTDLKERGAQVASWKNHRKKLRMVGGGKLVMTRCKVAGRARTAQWAVSVSGDDDRRGMIDDG